MLTYAKSINNALDRVMEDDERVYLIGEDIRDPYGGAFKITKGLSTKYPSRVINTPISEAGITGIAIGMAMKGLRPVVEIMFGDFLSLVADQILSNISKLSWMYNEKVSISLVIRTPMGGRRGYGPTHSQSIEKMFLGVPGIKIVAPSCFHDVGHLLEICIQDEAPVLFIEYKMDYSKSLQTPVNGRINEWFVRSTDDSCPTLTLSPTDFEDADVTVITYGGMAPLVKEAMNELLYEEEILSEIIVPSLIKPLQIDHFIPSVMKTGRVVVVEEGTLTNGWGAEVAARLSEQAFKYLRSPIKRVAAMDLPIGNSRNLEDTVLPSREKIIEIVKGIL